MKARQFLRKVSMGRKHSIIEFNHSLLSKMALFSRKSQHFCKAILVKLNNTGTSMSFSTLLTFAFIVTFYSFMNVDADRERPLNGDSAFASLRSYKTDVGRVQSKLWQASQHRCLPDQVAKDPQSTIDYQIVCVWPAGDIRPTRFIFGVINPKHINNGDLVQLAKHLKNQFSKYPAVRIFLWDNKEDARYYGEGTLDDTTGFENNLRVTYVLNQIISREYIEFTPDKAQPKNKVKIELR